MNDNFDVSLEKLEHLGLIKSIIKDVGIDTKMKEFVFMKVFPLKGLGIHTPQLH